jgi:hypothetical protein
MANESGTSSTSDSTTGWLGYSHPYSSASSTEPTFEWDQWVKNHTSNKEWTAKGWKLSDSAAEDAGTKAQAMHDRLAGADGGDGRTSPGLGCPSEIAKDLSLLSLYEVVLLVGKSHGFKLALQTA